MDRRRLVLVLGAAVGLAALAAPARAVDDELEDPNACTSPFGGSDSREGSVITVPGGLPMPTGTPPPLPSGIPGAPYPPPTATYVCSNGGWVPVSSAMEVGLRIDPDTPDVSVDEGDTALMTGTYAYAGDEPLVLAASVGQVSDLGGGVWSWAATPIDGPLTQAVTVTATAGETVATATFDVVVANVAPTVTGLAPASPVALVDQPVIFNGTATDPSAPDTEAGFTWALSPDPVTFDTCGTHTVSGTATDRDGGVSEPFTSTAVEIVEASFSDPLVAGRQNLVRTGQVVPVKVRIGCVGSSVAGLSPHLRLVAGDVDPGTTTDDPDQLVPAINAQGDTSGAMRQTGDSYVYNLKVPSAAKGALFTVGVSPSTGAGAINALLEIR